MKNFQTTGVPYDYGYYYYPEQAHLNTINVLGTNKIYTLKKRKRKKRCLQA